LTNTAELDTLITALTQAKILDEDRARSALAEFRMEQPNGNTQDAVQYFHREGVLTRYQAERAFAGEADKLILGPYLLLEPLGQGSLGTVFHGIHRQTREHYAIKSLPLRSLWKVMEARTLSERISALPKHPAVIPFEDVNTAGGSHYLAWPLVTGETLENTVRKFGPLMAADAARVMAEVADGLAVCHGGGIVHGLLKPSNLLLGLDRHARILDLGIGSILADNTDDESMIDTISSASASMEMMDYASPEVIADPTTRTPESDMYSFGCVLHFLVAGSPPFPDGTVVDKMIAHQSKTPISLSQLNPNVPEAFSQFTDRLLCKTPSGRPTAIEARDSLRKLNTSLRDATGSTNKLSLAMNKIAAALAEAKLGQATGSSGNISIPNIPLRPRHRPNDDEGSINFDDTISDILGSGPETPVSPVTPKERATNAIPKTAPTPEENPAAPAQTVSLLLPKPVDQPSSTSGRSRKVFDLPKPIGHENQASNSSSGAALPAVVIPPLPEFHRSFLSMLAFWRPKLHVVQVSIFGPPKIAPGQRVTFSAYAHAPESFNNAKTLCRAMHAEVELVGVGYLELPIPHGTDLCMTMAMTNAGLAKSDANVNWIGQLQPRTYDVFVPWECPAGVMSGVLTVSIQKKMAGSIPIQCLILPRAS
jgi:serine/threonine-protein kinase